MKNTTSKGGRGPLVCVWTCALVLALLVAVSASSVGACASTYISRDPEVLLLDTSTGKELTKTMNLFSSAYVNAEGQTVVASSDGESVVAPGTRGSYSFTVRNSGGTGARYKVWAEATQEGSDAVIPLELSLSNGERVSGDLADEGELASGTSAVYRIGWEWPFESGADADARDTALGQDAANRKVVYNVAVHMRAEADSDDAARAVTGHMPGTGDAALPVAPLALVGIVLVAIALLLLRCRRAADGR